MFGIVRILIGVFFFGCAVLIIIRTKTGFKRRKIIIFSILALVVATVLNFVPFENLFVTFGSPESAYRYVHSTPHEIKMVVNGETCDLVIGEKDADQYLIIPRSEDGWKIGLGIHTRLVEHKIQEDAIVFTHQYKHEQIYFVTVVIPEKGGM